MFQAETLDHVAFPVRDLPRSEKFYLETVGLSFLTQRKNADGSPRHTYMKAGENIVGLTLPGVAVPASTSGAPRYAIAMADEASFEAAVERIRASGVQCFDVESHAADSPFVKAFQFIDPDDNQIELCVRRRPLAAKDGLSHVIFETANLARAKRFYTEALGLKPVGEVRGETLFEFQNGQMVGVKEVKELSERTKKKGRACHVAFNVSQEDYDVMLERIPKLEGRSLGDFRATDGLRPPGERSIYFFDPDTNYLQITALGEEDWSLISDEEKWQRTIENRQKQGKGISSFDKGVKIQK
ncbi:MAG TPA: VOC family protein [Candidatus Binatia bacterium]|nr:VOC family protein [Candidatus Binatia bacterium]